MWKIPWQQVTYECSIGMKKKDNLEHESRCTNQANMLQEEEKERCPYAALTFPVSFRFIVMIFKIYFLSFMHFSPVNSSERPHFSFPLQFVFVLMQVRFTYVYLRTPLLKSPQLSLSLSLSIYIYIYIRILSHIQRHTHTHTHVYIYIYIYDLVYYTHIYE